ncbi:MAG: hypothetical protein UHS52_03555 [Alistipes sp.]|nr:hypothetical protein [Alistipes sp.]MEE1168081.1 hypothetical protein [Alistipes sp.]
MPLLIFIISAIMALLLLSSALVIWLGEVIGSLSLSLIIVGATYAIIATTLYFVAIHTTLRQWQRRMDTIYDVSLTVELIYRQVAGYVKKILGGL